MYAIKKMDRIQMDNIWQNSWITRTDFARQCGDQSLVRNSIRKRSAQSEGQNHRVELEST